MLNTLTQAGVLAEDKLFATLDPTTRMVRLTGNQEVLISDTVGFIQKLPTQLVAAFRCVCGRGGFIQKLTTQLVAAFRCVWGRGGFIQKLTTQLVAAFRCVYKR